MAIVKEKQVNKILHAGIMPVKFNGNNSGDLWGRHVLFNGKELFFCPMDIEISVFEIRSENNVQKKGFHVYDFFLDNDEVIEPEQYRRFVNDKLRKGEFEQIIINKIIPFLIEKSKL